MRELLSNQLALLPY